MCCDGLLIIRLSLGLKYFFIFFLYCRSKLKKLQFLSQTGPTIFWTQCEWLKCSDAEKDIYIYINLFNKLLQITGSRLADMAKSHCVLPVSDCVQNRTSDGWPSRAVEFNRAIIPAPSRSSANRVSGSLGQCVVLLNSNEFWQPVVPTKQLDTTGLVDCYPRRQNYRFVSLKEKNWIVLHLFDISSFAKNILPFSKIHQLIDKYKSIVNTNCHKRPS